MRVANHDVNADTGDVLGDSSSLRGMSTERAHVLRIRMGFPAAVKACKVLLALLGLSGFVVCVCNHNECTLWASADFATWHLAQQLCQ